MFCCICTLAGGGVGLSYSNSKADLIYIWIAKSCLAAEISDISQGCKCRPVCFFLITLHGIRAYATSTAKDS